jgi:TM2 domain-containing membrane protein YozV
MQPQPGYGPQQPGYGPQQPYAAQGYSQQGPAPGAKSATTAGLLGIFLGFAGAHSFYLGQKTLGIIHLCLGGGGALLCVLAIILPVMFLGGGDLGGAFGSVVLAPVLISVGTLAMSASGIWGLIEGVMCLTKSGKYAYDANGVPLS